MLKLYKDKFQFITDLAKLNEDYKSGWKDVFHLIVIDAIENLDIDVIHVDPPWGGKDYKTKVNLRLNFGTIPIETFVINSFTNDEIITKPLIISLKLPKNYDIEYLFENLDKICEIYLYELEKFNIIILEIIKK